jgi:hypothetical protein
MGQGCTFEGPTVVYHRNPRVRRNNREQTIRTTVLDDATAVVPAPTIVVDSEIEEHHFRPPSNDRRADGGDAPTSHVSSPDPPNVPFAPLGITPSTRQQRAWSHTMWSEQPKQSYSWTDSAPLEAPGGQSDSRATTHCDLPTLPTPNPNEATIPFAAVDVVPSNSLNSDGGVVDAKRGDY